MRNRQRVVGENEIQDFQVMQRNRRKFFSQLAGAGVGLGGVVGLLGTGTHANAQDTTSCPSFPPNAPVKPTPSDVDILNFALNLEYLEAEFYTMATTGHNLQQTGMDTNGVGPSGSTTGGAQIQFTNLGSQKVAMEIAQDEQKHVAFLRAALGNAAIAKPAINLNALGIGFGSMAEFLTVARAFEDVGVSAYGGAASLISDKTVLASAARIALTEALHAGNIRLQVAALEITVPYLDPADLLPPPAGANFFALDSNALAVVRQPSQVLSIVYANNASGTSSGGFFPSGLNGTIRAV